MAQTTLLHIVLLAWATFTILRATQSRVINAASNAAISSLSGQNETSEMKKFLGISDHTSGDFYHDDELQNKLLESDWDEDAHESLNDLIQSQEAQLNTPYLTFLNSIGGANTVFNSGKESTQKHKDGRDSHANTIANISDTSAHKIMLKVTRDRKTNKVDRKLLTDTVKRRLPKMIRLERNKVHPEPKQKLQGLKTEPLHRNRSKRQVELYMYNINVKNNSNASQMQMTQQTVCSALVGKEEIADNPLMCYQCESYSIEKEPRCDVVLWNYLRESEKHYIRIRCPKNRGHYCVKSVSRKGTDFSNRITRRGCVGPGPLQTKVGRHISLREGCISYVEGDYYTTTCFCKQDLCNEGAQMTAFTDGSIVTLIIFFWALFMYVFAFSFISR